MVSYSKLLESAQTRQSELVDMRRHLHENPETGWQEKETSAFIQRKLAGQGFKMTNGLAGHGFYIEVDSGKPGPMIAWRADMDALPIQDEKTVSYASKKEGIAHMCGHDVHSTIAYGIACLLKQNKQDFSGKIRVFWQPAEEVQPSGAPSMIKDGVLKNVSAVFGMHCDPHTPSGKISMREGPETAAFDSYEVTVTSASTQHSARPHRGADAMWIAHQMVQNLYQFIGRMIDPRDSTVLSICKFHGGDALNVIPRKVSFGFTVRTIREAHRKKMNSYITSLAASMAALYDVDIDVETGLGAPAVMNDKTLFENARREVINVLGPDHFVGREQSMGAEDFAFYTAETPGLFVRIGTSKNDDTSHPLHSSLFDIDESVLAPASAFLAHLLIQHTISTQN